MSLRLLIVALLCFVSTKQALTCKPGHRISHPSNCSMFITCDQGSKPKTFSCPHGLHFNAKKSYCDWPVIAKCDLQLLKVAEEGNLLINDAIAEMNRKKRDMETINIASKDKTNNESVKSMKKLQRRRRPREVNNETTNNGKKSNENNDDKSEIEEVGKSEIPETNNTAADEGVSFNMKEQNNPTLNGDFLIIIDANTTAYDSIAKQFSDVEGFNNASVSDYVGRNSSLTMDNFDKNPSNEETSIGKGTNEDGSKIEHIEYNIKPGSANDGFRNDLLNSNKSETLNITELNENDSAENIKVKVMNAHDSSSESKINTSSAASKTYLFDEKVHSIYRRRGETEYNQGTSSEIETSNKDTQTSNKPEDEQVEPFEISLKNNTTVEADLKFKTEEESLSSVIKDSLVLKRNNTSFTTISQVDKVVIDKNNSSTPTYVDVNLNLKMDTLNDNFGYDIPTGSDNSTSNIEVVKTSEQAIVKKIDTESKATDTESQDTDTESTTKGDPLKSNKDLPV